MSDCQTAVFRLVAESKLPLSTANIIQHLGYSEGTIRKTLTNLRRNRMFDSTGCRHFLTPVGKKLYQDDPNLTTLESVVGSYVRSTNIKTPKQSEFIKAVLKECEKTEIGRWVLSDMERAYIDSAYATAIAPYVAFFAIHAGVISTPQNYGGDTLDQSEISPKYLHINEVLKEIANLIESNGN